MDDRVKLHTSGSCCNVQRETGLDIIFTGIVDAGKRDDTPVLFSRLSEVIESHIRRYGHAV